MLCTAKYWAKPNIVLLIAAVLDPTLKLDYLKFYFHTIAESVETNMRDLCASLKKFYEEYEKTARREKAPDTSQSEQNLGAEPNSVLRAPVFGKRRVELAFEQFASQRLNQRSQRSELDKYLEDPRVIVSANEHFMF